jgi:zinc protease
MIKHSCTEQNRITHGRAKHSRVEHNPVEHDRVEHDRVKHIGRTISHVLVALSCCTLALAQRASAINIPFETYTLPNGLTVVLSTDHTAPTVAVNIWYHVGSKNELPGRTGFAHLFEHVMFTGSAHVLDIAKLNAQRDIVKNERRQRMDNQPYGRVFELLANHIYPDTHPYHWDVIGSMEDLSAASEEDVKNFFRLYYAPNNAFLTIVGDFDPPQAKSWVQKYFTDIPRGRPVPRPAVVPVTLTSAKRLTFEDRVQVPRLYLVWPTVGEKSDDRFALSVLGSILAGPRTAPLSKALVFDTQAAASVSASQNTNEDVGEFFITITPRPGHSLTELESAADTVLDKMRTEGPTAEQVQKATAGEELSFVRGLESNLGKAFQLATGAAIHGDPGYFRTEYQKTLAVTPADVKRVANKYLTTGRVALSVVPIGKSDQASKPTESQSVK